MAKITYLITIGKENFKILPHDLYTEAESQLYTVLNIGDNRNLAL